MAAMSFETIDASQFPLRQKRSVGMIKHSDVIDGICTLADHVTIMRKFGPYNRGSADYGDGSSRCGIKLLNASFTALSFGNAA
jgi:hypothetical protein